jgi:DNA adenine methylase
VVSRLVKPGIILGLPRTDVILGHSVVRPILRWAGSKRQLVPILLNSVPDEMTRYIEPFPGSACFFLALRPMVSVLSDINRDLIECYEALRDAPEEIGRAVRGMPRSASFYYRLRGCDPNAMERSERAARFIYLNRFCFNGVYRTNRDGQFNVPRGNRTGRLPHLRDFIAFGRALEMASVQACDFQCAVELAGAGDLVYLDPPYRKRPTGGYGEYGYNAFETADLPRFCAAVQQAHTRGATLLVSYSDSPGIKELFPGWHSRRVVARRHVSGFSGSRGYVHELLISNKPFRW